MSGGVDSSVAALRLVREGRGCIGATMILGTPDDERNVADAREVCRTLGIPHEVLDAREAFEALVKGPFYEAYRCGLTPNPCVACNRAIKFGVMLEMASELGCGHVATGHYAQLAAEGDRVRLLRAEDGRKDQSYFLSRIPADALRHVTFPLGALSKDEVRRQAAEAGLPVAVREESQDICFICGSVTEDLKQHLGTRPGNILDADGRIIGQHEGAHLYTIGQRKGLGVALGKPAYVRAKDADANVVMLGSHEDALTERVELVDVNLLAEAPGGPIRCSAQFRYNMEAVPCTLTVNGNRATVEFDEPAFAAAPGQTCALYEGDAVLGGGIIR